MSNIKVICIMYKVQNQLRWKIVLRRSIQDAILYFKWAYGKPVISCQELA